MKARIGRHKVDRIEALPKVVRDIGWKAQVRLCARYRRLSARGKNANVVNIAIAREMVVSLSQTLSHWQLIENRAMLSCDEGPLQAHWMDGRRSDPVAGSA